MFISAGLCWLLIVVVSICIGFVSAWLTDGSDDQKVSAFFGSGIIIFFLFSLAFLLVMDHKLHYSDWELVEPVDIVMNPKTKVINVISPDDTHHKAVSAEDASRVTGAYMADNIDDIVIWKRTEYTWWDNPWESEYKVGLRSDYNKGEVE